MARLASKEKMGFYPSPEITVDRISDILKSAKEEVYILDPCCGTGEALNSIKAWSCDYSRSKSFGVELDIERADEADNCLNTVIQGSIFNTIIEPEGSMGLLFLNPPYDDAGNREREEMRFLKHSAKWLCPDGILVFIVPEHIFTREKHRMWISSWFNECTIYRIVKEEYPKFKQVVLFGKKRSHRIDSPDLPQPPYPYIDEVSDIEPYMIPSTEEPSHFKAKDAVSDEEITEAGIETEALIRRHLLKDRLQGALSPLFPLRKGHLVALITAGFLNGKVSSGPDDKDFILIKGYSERVKSTSTDEDKEITTDTYRVGMRIIDPQARLWYDIV